MFIKKHIISSTEFLTFSPADLCLVKLLFKVLSHNIKFNEIQLKHIKTEYIPFPLFPLFVSFASQSCPPTL